MARILVVDDDADMRFIVREILKSAGHDVTVAVNGREGTVAYFEQRPDLVITDLFMPEKDGLTVIRELRAASPEVKIIAISGGGPAGEPGSLDNARTLGAVGALAKPFRISD